MARRVVRVVVGVRAIAADEVEAVDVSFSHMPETCQDGQLYHVNPNDPPAGDLHWNEANTAKVCLYPRVSLSHARYHSRRLAVCHVNAMYF